MDIVGTVTAPARLGLRIAEFGIRTGLHLARGVLPGGEEAEPAPAGPTVEEPPRPRPAERPGPRPAEPSRAAVPEDEPPPQPRHVDEGATVVAEVAEEGAEEGAGPEVGLAEPWEGYDRQTAEEILVRLLEASTEMIAAVALYERSTRARA